MFTAIIGANYGDEGKGLATNYFTREGKNLVVRHNGGAQSGHTVEVGDKRFVFHELSSGSFNAADTFWDSTYHPDLYVLQKECESFKQLAGFLPRIYAAQDVKITTLDDVLLNCFKESQSRAGSCGMGIWECVCRNSSGYGITVQEVQSLSVAELIQKLTDIRNNYTLPRLAAYSTMYGSAKGGEYFGDLHNPQMISNYAAALKENLSYVTIVDNLGVLLHMYDNVVFESGQGLLLDGDLDTEHGTPSKTGLYNVINRLNALGGIHLDEAVYVTRTYLTRHGRGNFVSIHDEISGITDQTNGFNEWQEDMRYGSFSSVESLACRVERDCMQSYAQQRHNVKPHLFVTHADAHTGHMLTRDGLVPISSLGYEKIYVSDNRFTVSDTINK